MRLIDADALLEKYNLSDVTKYGNKDAEQQARSYSTMMMYEISDMIEDAPTSYDVDKVVEQLEELTSEECTLHECGIRSEKCKACIAKKAIEIVKGGGVDA